MLPKPLLLHSHMALLQVVGAVTEEGHGVEVTTRSATGTGMDMGLAEDTTTDPDSACFDVWSG